MHNNNLIKTAYNQWPMGNKKMNTDIYIEDIQFLLLNKR